MPLRRLRKLAHGRFIDARVLLLCGGGPHADGKVWRVVEVVAALGWSQRTIERIKERFLEECLGTATVNLMRRFSMIPVFFAHPQVRFILRTRRQRPVIRHSNSLLTWRPLRIGYLDHCAYS